MSAEFGIALGTGESPVGLTMRQLIEVGLRRNPRRAQLLVSTVLGKHLPVDPRVAAGAGRLLGALVMRMLNGDDGPIPAEWPAAAAATVSGAEPGALLALLDPRPSITTTTAVLTLGFAETATSLGHLVADQLGSAYLHSTRRTDGAVPVAAEFSEPHSHATGHLLRPDPVSLLTGTGPVVLVDDELSTGRTALNVIEALQALAPRETYVLAGLVDLRSPADEENRAAIARRLGCRIEVVSLVRGSITVPPEAADRVWAAVGAPVAVEASDGTAQCSRLDLRWPAPVPQGGRHGFTPADRPAFDAAVRAAADSITEQSVFPQGVQSRILVVGTEELMYLPLMIALELARDGQRQIMFQSTTRSPVHAVDRAGYPIRRRIDFTSSDLSGDVPVPVARHLYNAAPPSPGGEELAEVDLVVVIDDGHAVEGPDGVAARVAAATGRPVILAVLTSSTAAAADSATPASAAPASAAPSSALS